MEHTVNRLEALIRDMAPNAQAAMEVLIEETARRGFFLAIVYWTLAAMLFATACIWNTYAARKWITAPEYSNHLSVKSDWGYARWVTTVVLAVLTLLFAMLGTGCFADYMSPSLSLFENAVR